MARTKRGSGRDNGLRPTSGKEAREAREVGYVKQLWTGMVARLRTPDLADLLAQGQIPDALTPIVSRMLFYGIDAKDSETMSRYRQAADLTPAEAAAWLETLRVVCTASFMEPRIVDNPQADDEISIADVHPLDRLLVWDFAVGGAALLKTFRAESLTNVELVLDGETDAQPAEHVDATE